MKPLGTPGHPLKLKAIFISEDQGKTWLLVRQHYLTDVFTNGFLDDIIQGRRFNMTDGDSTHDDRTKA
jgi:hypothetical protein